MIAGAIAILISAGMLMALAVRDPKRLRAVAHARSEAAVAIRTSPSARRVLGLLVLAPGVLLALGGQWWAFLAWLGAVTSSGWLAARGLAVGEDR